MTMISMKNDEDNTESKEFYFLGQKPVGRGCLPDTFRGLGKV